MVITKNLYILNAKKKSTPIGEASYDKCHRLPIGNKDNDSTVINKIAMTIFFFEFALTLKEKFKHSLVLTICLVFICTFDIYQEHQYLWLFVRLRELKTNSFWSNCDNFKCNSNAYFCLLLVCVLVPYFYFNLQISALQLRS